MGNLCNLPEQKPNGNARDVNYVAIVAAAAFTARGLYPRPCLYSHAVIVPILPSRPRGTIGRRSACCLGGRGFAARLLHF